MSFSLPSFQRVPLKEQTSKDVNKEFKYGAEIGFGTYGYFINIEFYNKNPIITISGACTKLSLDKTLPSTL